MTLPRDVQSELDKLGLELLSLRTKKHLVLYLRNSHGVTRTISICKTPSDRRSRLNELSDLRRFARVDNPKPVRQEPDGGKKGQT